MAKRNRILLSANIHTTDQEVLRLAADILHRSFIWDGSVQKHKVWSNVVRHIQGLADEGVNYLLPEGEKV